MAVGKEILTKIRSVQNTQKITKAMQMVSTSKMRKTQERMRLARPYAEKVRLVMSHLAQTNSDHGIKLLEPHREIRKAGFILITSDKGLCGGLNANVLKRFLAQVQEYQEKGIAVEVVCLGSKGLAACQNIGLNIIASATNLGDTPKMETLLGPLTEIFQHGNGTRFIAVIPVIIIARIDFVHHTLSDGQQHLHTRFLPHGIDEARVNQLNHI